MSRLLRQVPATFTLCIHSYEKKVAKSFNETLSCCLIGTMVSHAYNSQFSTHQKKLNLQIRSGVTFLDRSLFPTWYPAFAYPQHN
jgi:hypothetical protein